METGHVSVLTREVLEGLAPKPGGVYVDATFGAGGHTRAILEAIAPQGRVMALDRDPDAVTRGEALARLHPDRLRIRHAAFKDIGAELAEWDVGRVDGILFDLGVSSFQLDEPERGFSFRFDGPLDMRMDYSKQPGAKTAAQLVNGMNEMELADIFFRYGEESRSRKVARAIVQQRQKQPFTNTLELARLAEKVIPSHKRGIHAATKIFQALRIAVNSELEQLQTGLEQAMAALAPDGRLLVISFHSLEDRIVKQTFRRVTTQPPLSGPEAMLPQKAVPPLPFAIMNKKPITPGPEEQANNPRSRSAKLRILKRLFLEDGPQSAEVHAR